MEAPSWFLCERPMIHIYKKCLNSITHDFPFLVQLLKTSAPMSLTTKRTVHIPHLLMDRANASQTTYSEDGSPVRPPRLASHGPTPPIHALIEFFDLSSKSKIKHDKRREYLSLWFEVSFSLFPYIISDLYVRLFQRWRKQVGPDLYPVLRLLLPQVYTWFLMRKCRCLRPFVL